MAFDMVFTGGFQTQTSGIQAFDCSTYQELQLCTVQTPQADPFQVCRPVQFTIVQLLLSEIQLTPVSSV